MYSRKLVSVDPKESPEVLALARSAFPGWRGRKLKIGVMPESSDINTDWCDGSRDTYAAVGLATRRQMPLSTAWGERKKIERSRVPDGVAIAEHTIYRGKDLGVTLYVKPENMNQLALPAAVKLTAFERLVLAYTSARKSSYAGRNRKQQAWDDYKGHCRAGGYLERLAGEFTLETPYPGWDAPVEERKASAREFSRRWDAAVERLIGRKLLRKNKSITPAGRNAVSV